MTAIHTGDQIDHYQIEGVAARSGMASIFRGIDVRTGRTVAIKVPHPEMEGDPSSSIVSPASRRSARSSTIPA